MTITTIDTKPAGFLRGRNGYSRMATIIVEDRPHGFSGGRTIRLEARSPRMSELAPAWLEMTPEAARDMALAILEVTGD